MATSNPSRLPNPVTEPCSPVLDPAIEDGHNSSSNSSNNKQGIGVGGISGSILTILLQIRQSCKVAWLLASFFVTELGTLASLPPFLRVHENFLARLQAANETVSLVAPSSCADGYNRRINALKASIRDGGPQCMWRSH